MSANQCNFNFPLLLSWGSISSPQRCDSTWCRHVVACALSGTTNTVEKNCYDHTTALTDDAPSVSDVGFCQKKKKDNLQNNVAFRSVDVLLYNVRRHRREDGGLGNFFFTLMHRKRLLLRRRLPWLFLRGDDRSSLRR